MEHIDGMTREDLQELLDGCGGGFWCEMCEAFSDGDEVPIRECPHCETTFDGEENGRNCPDCNRPFSRKVYDYGCPDCLEELEPINSDDAELKVDTYLCNQREREARHENERRAKASAVRVETVMIRHSVSDDWVARRLDLLVRKDAATSPEEAEEIKKQLDAMTEEATNNNG